MAVSSNRASKASREVFSWMSRGSCILVSLRDFRLRQWAHPASAAAEAAPALSSAAFHASSFCIHR